MALRDTKLLIRDIWCRKREAEFTVYNFQLFRNPYQFTMLPHFFMSRLMVFLLVILFCHITNVLIIYLSQLERGRRSSLEFFIYKYFKTKFGIQSIIAEV